METRDVKPPLKFTEQLDLLVGRGCDVGDVQEAIAILEKVNYYRLSAYFLPFKDGDKYIMGTKLKTVYQRHEFDRELSYLLFGVIVSLELRLRTQISYRHAHTYGALGYLESENFLQTRHNHDKFMKSINRNIQHHKRQMFVRHHLTKYGGNFPLWVIVELFTLGDLSHFYADMKMADRKAISNQYNTTPKNLASWLICLTNLRNYCTHYTRLYFNKFAAVPATPRGYPHVLGKFVFDYILVLKFLSVSNPDWNNSFVVQLEALLEKYQDYIDLAHLGFPQNWLVLLKS
ncbi:MAG: Abi family protein [Oscillospiraceae bacterium]|nr:Abi family protein [Oscillospiraceae bacterium]